MYMFNESQKALKDKVGSFVRKEVMPVAQELDKNGIFPTQLIKRCGGICRTRAYDRRSLQSVRDVRYI